MELELTRLLVPLLHLDIVVPGVPRHSLVVEATAPIRLGGRPEVHNDALRLCQKLHILGVLGLATEFPIDGPGDVVRGPLDNVLVPRGARLEPLTV